MLQNAYAEVRLKEYVARVADLATKHHVTIHPMQVHDELIVEGDPDDVAAFREALEELDKENR